MPTRRKGATKKRTRSTSPASEERVDWVRLGKVAAGVLTALGVVGATSVGTFQASSGASEKTLQQFDDRFDEAVRAIIEREESTYTLEEVEAARHEATFQAEERLKRERRDSFVDLTISTYGEDIDTLKKTVGDVRVEQQNIAANVNTIAADQQQLGRQVKERLDAIADRVGAASPSQ